MRYYSRPLSCDKYHTSIYIIISLFLVIKAKPIVMPVHILFVMLLLPMTFALPQTKGPGLAGNDVIVCPDKTIGYSQLGPDAADGMKTLACCPYQSYLSQTDANDWLQCSYSWFSVAVVPPIKCQGGAKVCRAHPHGCCFPL